MPGSSVHEVPEGSRTQLSKWAYESKGQAWWNSRICQKALWLVNDRTEPWTWISGINLFPYISLWTCLEVKGYYHIWCYIIFKLSLTGTNMFHNLRLEKSSIFRKDSSEKPVARGISDRQIQDKILTSEGTDRLLWKIMESLSLCY